MCGGGFISNVFDDFSDIIGTGGGDTGLLNVIDEGVQSVGGALADIDPGPAIGSALADIDPGPAIGDIGATIDDAVLQPMLDDPIATIATVAAISTGQAYLLPVIAGAKTAADGGDLKDIALSAGTAYLAGQFAPGISEWAGGGLTGAVTTGAVLGAGGAAATTAVRGGDIGDIGDAALRGGISGGVAGGVSYGVGQAYDAIRNEFMETTPPPVVEPDVDFTAPKDDLDLFLEDYYANESFAAQEDNTDLAERPANSEYGLEEVPAAPVKIPDNAVEKLGKKIVSNAITGSILSNVFDNNSATAGSRSLGRRREGTGSSSSATDTMLDGEIDSNVNLNQVLPSKFELRKYANQTGQSTLISFKDDQPQSPIPAGYSEVERIGAAEGGLMSNNMIKYSKKPLIGSRKVVTRPKEQATSKKGLGVRPV